MVDELKKIISHPTVISSFLCIFFICSKIIPIKNSFSYKEIILNDSIFELKGRILSNPSIDNSGKYYSFKINISEVKGNIPFGKRTNEITINSNGTSSIMIDAEQIECLYPGKLNTTSKALNLLEENAKISATVLWSRKFNTFIINKVQSVSYDNNFTGRIDYLRAICRLVFKKLMYSWGEAGAFILSLLSGSRDYLSPETRKYFTNAGLAHILALSGMHLSFFSSMANTIGKKITGRKYVFILQILCIMLFIWFAGLSPSLFRALLCSLFMLIAKKTDCSSTQFIAVLAFIFLIHIIIFPSDIVNIAFMLSYSALAGMIIISPIIESFISKFFPSILSSSISSSIGAQVASFPVSLHFFGKFYPIGIISSSIVSPLVTLFLKLSVICIIISLLFPFLSTGAGYILNRFFDIIKHLTSIFAMTRAVSI